MRPDALLCVEQDLPERTGYGAEATAMRNCRMKMVLKIQRRFQGLRARTQATPQAPGGGVTPRPRRAATDCPAATSGRLRAPSAARAAPARRQARRPCVRSVRRWPTRVGRARPTRTRCRTSSRRHRTPSTSRTGRESYSYVPSCAPAASPAGTPPASAPSMAAARRLSTAATARPERTDDARLLTPAAASPSPRGVRQAVDLSGYMLMHEVPMGAVSAAMRLPGSARDIASAIKPRRAAPRHKKVPAATPQPRPPPALPSGGEQGGSARAVSTPSPRKHVLVRPASARY